MPQLVLVHWLWPKGRSAEELKQLMGAAAALMSVIRSAPERMSGQPRWRTDPLWRLCLVLCQPMRFRCRHSQARPPR